jgi:hypothetical protein
MATVTVLPPPAPEATIVASPSSVAEGGHFTISWSSSNAIVCSGTGGALETNIQWQGILGDAGSRVIDLGTTPIGDYLYSVSCPSIDTSQAPVTADVLVTVGSPGISLLGTNTSVVKGSSFTLNWDVHVASSCIAGGGGANGTPWSGALATTGSVTQAATVAGKFTYTLTCTVNGVSRQANYVLTVTGSASGSPSGGSSSGGGGALGAWELLLFALLFMHVCARTNVVSRTYLN